MEMMKKLIYIAGPFTNKSRLEEERNIRRAEDAIAKILAQGNIPICVHSMFRFFSSEPYDFYYITRLIMERCDALYMLRGWAKSFGAKMELERAQILGKEIFYEE